VLNDDKQGKTEEIGETTASVLLRQTQMTTEVTPRLNRGLRCEKLTRGGLSFG
jgi:hypothetical protein